jgi:MoaA/NifB/PqqE/SkfB family radical SAM enzyme
MMPYLAELTDQVALGGGEPFLFPQAIMALGKTCKKNGLIMNVTTNGTQPMKPEYVKDVEMVSISLDKYKRPRIKDLARYAAVVQQLRKHTRVGTNLLIDSAMMKRKETFPMLVKWLFESVEVERVFALYPKNWEFIDILPLTDIYAALSTLYKHFYVDDATNMILRQQRYNDWKEPCHYGKSIISLNELGEVTGCSFDDPEKAMLKLEKPEDIMEIKKVKFEERYSCPYLKVMEST